MKHSYFKLGIAAACVALLASCGIYKRPAEIKTGGLYGDMLPEQDTASLAALSWRELYTDALLQQLIESALTRNTDLRIQQWAIEQAETSHKASKLAFLPSLSFTPAGGYQYSNNAGLNTGWSYSVPVALSWEVDVFGSLRNQKKRMKANLMAQRDARDAIQSRLVANIASLYHQLQAYDQQLVVLDQAIQASNEMTATAEAMMQSGMTDAISVSQFRGRALEYKTLRLEVERSIEHAELTICALLAQTPHHIERSDMQTAVMPQALATGVSSQLLDRRPDVRQAERTLEAYYYGVQMARSDFYPKVTLGGSALYNGDFVTSFLGSLAQPIFNRYRTVEAYKHAQAAYAQAKLAYEQRLLDAASEVVQAVTSHRTAQRSYELRTQQVEEYAKAVNYSREQMFNGNATYLDVLTSQNDLYAKQMSAISDRLETFQGIISVYLALGGGVQ